MSAFLGMRGTGDWATDERPKNWREGILYLYPNGSAPLTAVMSKMGNESVNDAEYNWWTKTLPAQAATITGIYTDSSLSTALATAGTSGQALYVKAAEAEVDEFRAGHVALLRYSSDYMVDCVAKVTGVQKNGANSYVAVTLLEADDNSSTNNLTNADRILVIGSMNAEGAGMPDAIAYNPTKVYNYTQIFRTPLSITRTARKTKLRTKDSYTEQKREALELHSIEMEKGLLWGIRTENVGSNGKYERTTMGLINFIKIYGSANVSDFTLETTLGDHNFAGKSWIDEDGGELWLDTILEQIFRYGDMEKMAFAGSGALLGINRIVKTRGTWEMTSMKTSYGIKVAEWVTPFGSIYIKTHPLFSYETTNRNSMVIFEPRRLKFRYIDDTTFYPDGEKQNTGRNRVDGTDEEYLTECGLEFHHPLTGGYLNGIGKDNDLA